MHNYDGMVSVSLAEYPQDIDERIIQATAELPDEFPFNRDLNSGYNLGIGGWKVGMFWHRLTS